VSKPVLVRLCDKQLNERLGVLVEDSVRRDVTFAVRQGLDSGERTLPGLSLIGPDDGPNGLEDIRRRVGECLLKILSTDEVWWLPLNARRDGLTGLWTIESVPLVAWTRVSSRTDESILTASGYDPATARPAAETMPGLADHPDLGDDWRRP
jgi:hypothetical protein